MVDIGGIPAIRLLVVASFSRLKILVRHTMVGKKSAATVFYRSLALVACPAAGPPLSLHVQSVFFLVAMYTLHDAALGVLFWSLHMGPNKVNQTSLLACARLFYTAWNSRDRVFGPEKLLRCDASPWWSPVRVRHWRGSLLHVARGSPLGDAHLRRVIAVRGIFQSTAASRNRHPCTPGNVKRDLIGGRVEPVGMGNAHVRKGITFLVIFKLAAASRTLQDT